MEIQGTIIKVLPIREGTSARGPWKSQDYVLETEEQYPKRFVFNAFGGDRIEQFGIKENEKLKVYFDIDAHEFNERWYNTVRAWKVERIGEEIPEAQPDGGTIISGPQQPAPFPQQPAPFPPQPAPFPQQPAPFPPQPESEGGSDDDLPF